jgi:ADP-ribosyl-[dinitrogen reductase] hydrolase
MRQPDIAERFRGCLLGLAAGDAVGTTVEFKERGTFPELHDMIGGGPFRLKAGQWTDDTAMALCLAASLAGLGRFDARDQMERYWRWRTEGYMSSTGVCFDIGTTTARALQRFRETDEPFAGSTDPGTAGNGCIMRLAPVPMFFYPDETTAIEHAVASSRTTHAADECLDASALFASVLVRTLDGVSRDDILFAPCDVPLRTESIRAIARGEYRDKSVADVRGSGHVLACLEAALWVFARTDDFRTAILMAANLGDDADTTAAVCGQVAGAFYGASGIPGPWLERLAMRRAIEALADALRMRR